MRQFEFFGDESQITLQRRYYRLWQYLKVHPRLAFTGRSIGLDDPQLSEVAELAGLVKEMGFLSLTFTRAAIVDQISADLEEEGLTVGRWSHWLSNDQPCRHVARSWRKSISLLITALSESRNGLQASGCAPFKN